MPGQFLGRGMGGLMQGGAAAAWWVVAGKTCVAAYQPKGAASLAASYINLANPGTYNAAPGKAPTLAAGGWAFNGIDQYLTTGIVPANSQAWSMIVQYSDCPIDTSTIYIVCGMSESTNQRFQLSACNGLGAGSTCVFANGQNLSVGAILATGNLAIAGATGYRNGTAQAGTSGAWGSAPTIGIYIGARNNIGSPQYYFAGAIAAIAIYNATLTAPQVLAINTAMAAL